MAFPGVYSFAYYKGDTSQFVIRPKNSDGSAFDLTNFTTAAFTIASARGDNPSFSVAANADVNTSTNIVTCTIEPSIGLTLSEGRYVYDVEIINTTASPDIVYTLLTGIITVTEQVSGAA
jgi:hypothetical protein